MSLPHRRPMVLIATLVGRLLGVVFFVVAKLRGRSRMALHPRGEMCQGLLRREGSARPTGVVWIDDPGLDQVEVRLSRATGLPEPWPDVLGLALRVPIEGGSHGDLLLSTTGTGAFTRFILRPTRHPASAYTSIVPYQSPSGPLLLAALPLAEDGSRFALAWSGLRGAWSRFGVLDIPTPAGDGQERAQPFDAVQRPVPGLISYPLFAQLRRYAYAASRRARGAVLS